MKSYSDSTERTQRQRNAYRLTARDVETFVVLAWFY